MAEGEQVLMTEGRTTEGNEEPLEASTYDQETEEVGSGHEQETAEPDRVVGSVRGHGDGVGRYNDPASTTEPLPDSGTGGRVMERGGRDYSQRYLPDGEADSEGVFPESSIVAARAEYHSGPLPQPEVLARYGEAGADFPERIMTMAEDESAARIENQRRESKTAAMAVTAGVYIVGLATLLSLVVAVVLALKGVPYWWAVIALPVITAIPRIIRAAKGLPDDDEDTSEAPPPAVK